MTCSIRSHSCISQLAGKVKPSLIWALLCPHRLPQYNRSILNELQDKFYELESAGVIAKPKQVNFTVEYFNPSSLVRKSHGGSKLVTSFGAVAQYSKPQPSLMPSVDSVLRQIAKWNYIIELIS